MGKRKQKPLEKLTEAVLDSYSQDRRTQRVGHAFLPSRQNIVGILQEMRQLLFPGYFGQQDLTEENVRFHVGNLLARIKRDLADQIYNCLCTAQQNCLPEDCRKQAEKITRKFLATIPDVCDKLALDAQAAYDGDPAAKSIDEVIYCYPGFYAVTVYRVAHELAELGVPLMPRIMTEYAHSVTGTDIHPRAHIGKSFFIDHATGVVIGETTEIGDNVKMYQGVTLGAMSFPKDERGRVIKGLKRHPTIEDNVTIYSNATILGGKTVIGKGATVGGNTFVSDSIPPGKMVVQQPPPQRVETKKKKKRSRK